MMVTVISDELLKQLNDGKTIDIDFGQLGATIASEKWLKRMEKSGNIKNTAIIDDFERVII